MPRSIEGMLANHQAANERRAAGKPIWDYILNIKHLCDSEDVSDEACTKIAHSIAAALRRQLPKEWFDFESDDFDEDLEMIVDNFRWAGSDVNGDYSVRDEVNGLMDDLYDWADAKRVWIG